jgi:hypothetical protein
MLELVYLFMFNSWDQEIARSKTQPECDVLPLPHSLVSVVADAAGVQ